MNSGNGILIIDNDEGWIHFLKRILKEDGYKVKILHRVADLGETMFDERYDIALIGEEYLPEAGSVKMSTLHELAGGKRFIVFHRPQSWPNCLVGMRKAFKSGAEDWIEKSYVNNKISALLDRALKGGTHGKKSTNINY